MPSNACSSVRPDPRASIMICRACPPFRIELFTTFRIVAEVAPGIKFFIFGHDTVHDAIALSPRSRHTFLRIWSRMFTL